VGSSIAKREHEIEIVRTFRGEVTEVLRAKPIDRESVRLQQFDHMRIDLRGGRDAGAVSPKSSLTVPVEDRLRESQREKDQLQAVRGRRHKTLLRSASRPAWHQEVTLEKWSRIDVSFSAN
jgi:hypothetical protein